MRHGSSGPRPALGRLPAWRSQSCSCLNPSEHHPKASCNPQCPTRTALPFTCAVLDHSAPQPASPQTGQVPHDQQVPPPPGQGHVRSLLRVDEPHLPGPHTGQNDDVLLSPLEGVDGGHLHGPEAGPLEVHGAEQVTELWGRGTVMPSRGRRDRATLADGSTQWSFALSCDSLRLAWFLT